MDVPGEVGGEDEGEDGCEGGEDAGAVQIHSVPFGRSGQSRRVSRRLRGVSHRACPILDYCCGDDCSVSSPGLSRPRYPLYHCRLVRKREKENSLVSH